MKWHNFAPDIGGVVNEKYRTIKAGHGFYDDEDPEFGFNLTGYISPKNANLITAAPELLAFVEMVKSNAEARKHDDRIWFALLRDAEKLLSEVELNKEKAE